MVRIDEKMVEKSTQTPDTFSVSSKNNTTKALSDETNRCETCKKTTDAKVEPVMNSKVGILFCRALLCFFS